MINLSCKRLARGGDPFNAFVIANVAGGRPQVDDFIVAQQIAQEVMATGVYFEPWNQVIAAYQRRLARIDKGNEHRLDLDG